MKKNYILLLLCTFHYSMIGQYIPMLGNGTHWNIFHINETSFNFSLKEIKDTIIEDEIYKIFNLNIFGGNNKIIYREDSSQQRVYEYLPSLQESYLLYDFDINVGDTVNIGGLKSILERISIVDKLPFEIWNNVGTYKLNVPIGTRVYFFEQDLVLVEGIGLLVGPFDSGGSDYLVCHFNEKGEQDLSIDSIFTDPIKDCLGEITIRTNDIKTSSLSIMPNLTSNEISIRHSYNNFRNIDIVIFNYLGNECKRIIGYQSEERIDVHDLASGIYFVQMIVDGHLISSGKFVKE